MATNDSIITVSYSDTGHTRTVPVFQYDYGHKLDLAEFESLPETFEMHFAPVGAKESITMLGSNGMVDVPDTLLRQKQSVFGWLFLHDGETDGETKYIVEIPVIARAAPSDKEYTPEEHDLVTQAVAALQAAVERVGGLEDTVDELGENVEGLLDGTKIPVADVQTIIDTYEGS